MILESAPLALRDTVEASIEMVAADAARKGLDVAYRLAPPLERRRLLGDSIRIRQVGTLCCPSAGRPGCLEF
jgi:hypothetical protein